MKNHTRYVLPRLCVLVLCAILLSGCLGAGGSDPYSKRYTAREINPNPGILNNTIVKGTDLSNLRLENVTIKDATFYNTTATGTVFKNVVFDNCRFINAKFTKANLENVLFRGGLLTCADDANNIKYRTQFTNSRFVNTVFDGTYLENPVFNGSDCSIAFRNCFQIRAIEPLITGTDIHLTLERSRVR